ncbi:MAG: putative acyltransferase [Arcticibacterium sp.]|jgi:predicted acyltransferase
MKNRLTSIDIFRGMTLMLMTLVNNPGDWGNVITPFLHAEWHGCSPTDLVFPYFLFIVGITTVLASPEPSFDKNRFLKISVRGLRIFTLGLFLNFFSKIQLFGLEGYGLLAIRLVFVALVYYLLLTKYDLKKQLYAVLSVLGALLFLAYWPVSGFEEVRVPGVLQRIAIVYFVVAILYNKFSLKVLGAIALILLLGYWAAMALIPIDGVSGVFDKDVNVAAAFDRIFLEGHMWASSKTWDPEGLFSTIPAIVTGILGVFVGKFLIGEKSKTDKMNYLVLAGVVLVAIGYFWHKVFPINKALWTSSYVVYTAGLATLVLAIIYFLVEQLESKFWIKPFLIFGVNPILIFFFSGIIPRVFSSIKIGSESLQPFVYRNLSTVFTDLKYASLAWAVLYLLFWFLILAWFYRKKIFVKV